MNNFTEQSVNSRKNTRQRLRDIQGVKIWRGLAESWLCQTIPVLGGLSFGIRIIIPSLWVRGQRLMELEEFVSGHTEISSEPGIWSWVSLIPKDHGFPIVYFLDFCTDFAPHSTCLYPTQPTLLVSSHVVSQTLRLCPIILVIFFYCARFSWSIFIIQPVGTTHSLFPFILSWPLHWSPEGEEAFMEQITIPQWGIGSESFCFKAGTTIPVFHSILTFLLLWWWCVLVCWLVWEQLCPRSSFGEHR